MKKNISESIKELENSESIYTPYRDGSDMISDKKLYRRSLVYFLVSGFLFNIALIYFSLSLFNNFGEKYYATSYNGDVYRIGDCQNEKRPVCRTSEMLSLKVE